MLSILQQKLLQQARPNEHYSLFSKVRFTLTIQFLGQNALSQASTVIESPSLIQRIEADSCQSIPQEAQQGSNVQHDRPLNITDQEPPQIPSTDIEAETASSVQRVKRTAAQKEASEKSTVDKSAALKVTAQKATDDKGHR